MGYSNNIIEGRKLKAVKMLGPPSPIKLANFPQNFNGVQKQSTPVFLAMPSLYSLKCCVTNFRYDVSNWDRGLVVHALDAATNLLPIGFLCILSSQ